MGSESLFSCALRNRNANLQRAIARVSYTWVRPQLGVYRGLSILLLSLASVCKCKNFFKFVVCISYYVLRSSKELVGSRHKTQKLFATSVQKPFGTFSGRNLSQTCWNHRSY